MKALDEGVETKQLLILETDNYCRQAEAVIKRRPHTDCFLSLPANRYGDAQSKGDSVAPTGLARNPDTD